MPVQTDHAEAALIAENSALKPGGAQNWLALRLKPETGWHVYWQNPGDSGLATKLSWTLPEGMAAGEIQWPFPQMEKLGELTNYGYGEETLHLVPVSVPSQWPAGKTVELKAEAKWLVCKDICIPGKADLSLSLPVSNAVQADARWAEAFARTRARLPVETPGLNSAFSAGAGDFNLSVHGPQLQGASAAEFYPLAGDLVAHAAPQRVAFDSDGLRLSQKLSPYFIAAPASAEGVLVLKGALTRAYRIHAQPGSVAAVTQASSAAPVTAQSGNPSLAVALLSALLGGLILNLMPCVFPVLSFKALKVMKARDENHAHQRHALSYTAGTVLSCVAVAGVLLALRAGGEAIGWGFQFQSPVFVAVLAYLMFALGLAMSGLIELGAGLMGLGQSLTQKSGLAGSFFTGVLATIVASPCTAPFMGTALGYAVTQPAPVALLVFAMLGLGLALPFLLLGFFPSLAAALPRPGAWMETFKQLMAFPLYLTAVWLLWVTVNQVGADGAALIGSGFVLIAFALWLWNRQGAMPVLLRYAALAGALALLAHPALRTESRPPAVAGAQSEAWSEQRVNQLRAEHRSIFVNFTADWCITCKVNESVALDSERVQQIFKQKNVARLTGDWTRSDPAITGLLASFGRNGVPLYLVYVNGGAPKVLPQLLTPDIVIDSLN